MGIVDKYSLTQLLIHSAQLTSLTNFTHIASVLTIFSLLMHILHYYHFHAFLGTTRFLNYNIPDRKCVSFTKSSFKVLHVKSSNWKFLFFDSFFNFSKMPLRSSQYKFCGLLIFTPFFLWRGKRHSIYTSFSYLNALITLFWALKKFLVLRFVVMIMREFLGSSQTENVPLRPKSYTTVEK